MVSLSQYKHHALPLSIIATRPELHHILPDLIESCLKEQTYIYLFYNGYHLQYNKSYLRYDFPNNMLIFGFHAEDSMYHIFDYNYKKSGKLQEMKVRKEDLIRAVQHIDGPDWIHRIALLKLKPFHEQPTLDLHFARDLVIDYIKSQNTFERFYNPLHEQGHSVISIQKNAKFGLEIYDVLNEYVQSILNKTHHPSFLPFHVLWEHKVCLLSLI